MSRIRSIHPGLFTDDAFMALSMAARVTLTGLWTEADDHGVFSWKPLTLKARLLPADNIDMNGILQELEASRFLHRFRDGDREFGIIRNFRKYQRPKKPTYSYPFPAEYGSFIGLGSESSVPVGNWWRTGSPLVGKSLRRWRMEEVGGKKKEEIIHPHSVRMCARRLWRTTHPHHPREVSPKQFPDQSPSHTRQPQNRREAVRLRLRPSRSRIPP